MNKLITIGVITAELLLATASTAPAAQKIITFDASARAGIDKSMEAIGGKVIRKFELIDAVVVEFPDSTRDSRVYALKGVTNVEEDRYINWLAATQPDMPLPSVEDALTMIRTGEGWDAPVFSAITPEINRSDSELTWGVKRLNVPAAWNHTGGEGVKVAVLDTGVDYTHPDLAPNYKGGYNAVAPDSPPLDDNGHGTHVAGTIAAVRDLNGVVGVAPKADLYSIKAADKKGSGHHSWIAAGIEWAIQNKIDVINISLAGPADTPILEQIMIKAKEAGITVVCAAGNDSGAVNYPARFPQAIAVSASKSSDKLASFSSRGPEVALIAPGVRIYSTRKGGGHTNMSGTSMASPHVAGLAVLAVAAGAHGPDAVRAALVGAAKPLPGLTAEEQGAGLVDAALLAR